MSLALRPEGDRSIVMTRRFEASPDEVYRAHVEPELIRKWMLGPPGWDMPVCVNVARPGGSFRFVWQKAGEGRLGVTGEYIELTPGERIEHVERMHTPDPTPDNHIVTTFAAEGEGTLLRVVISLPHAAARDALLASETASGMEASYGRIDQALNAT